MLASALWFIVWGFAILTAIVTLESVIKDKQLSDVEIWCFWLCPFLWAAIVVFWFN